MNKKEPVQRRESERLVKGEGDISGWKTEAFKCPVNARQAPLIVITCFLIGARLPACYVCFYFSRVEHLVKKVEELHESLQQIVTNHTRDQQ